MDPAKNRVSLTCPKCYVKHLSAALAHTENARAAMNAIVASDNRETNEANFIGLLHYVSTTDDEIKFLLPEFMNAITHAKICVARAEILLDEAERYSGHEFMALGCLLDAELELNADITTMHYRHSNELLSDCLIDMHSTVRFYRLALQERAAQRDPDLASCTTGLDYTITHINSRMGPIAPYLDGNMERWHDNFVYAQAHLMEACREMPDPNDHKIHSPFVGELFIRYPFPFTSKDRLGDSAGILEVPNDILFELNNLSDSILNEIDTFTKNSDPNVFSSEDTH